MTATMATLKRVKQERQTGLRKVLYDLAIDPFDIQTVEEYKANALKPYQWRNTLVGWYSPVDSFLKGSTVISALLCLVAGLAIPAIAAHSKLLSAETSLTCLWWTSLIPLCLFISVGIFDNIMSRVEVPSWKLNFLTNYKQPIPEFVQQTVDDIKASGQSCEFFICYMAFDQVHLPDPFLVLRCIDENYRNIEYYVEVWNESYQKKRVV